MESATSVTLWKRNRFRLLIPFDFFIRETDDGSIIVIEIVPLFNSIAFKWYIIILNITNIFCKFSYYNFSLINEQKFFNSIEREIQFNKFEN